MGLFILPLGGSFKTLWVGDPLPPLPVKKGEITSERPKRPHLAIKNYSSLKTFGITKSRTSLLTVINALVFSKLYYCSNVWANTTEKNIRKLQAVQNYACRIVSGARKYDHVTPHLKSLSWLPVKDQLYYRQAIMAFKCISGHAPKYLSSQFITREQVTKRTTRSGQKLDIPLFKTASGQRTFYYRTIGLWNNLDPFLKSSCSVQVFKRILKNKLLDNFVNTP